MAKEPTRDELLAQPAKVKIDVSGAPLLGGEPPIDDPRVYGMTDDEAVAWNQKIKAEGEAKNKLKGKE